MHAWMLSLCLTSVGFGALSGPSQDGATLEEPSLTAYLLSNHSRVSNHREDFVRMFAHESERLALMVDAKGDRILAVFLRGGIICEISDKHELSKLKLNGQDLIFGSVTFKYTKTFLVHTAAE